MGFPFLTIFMIFIIWLAIRYRRLDQNQKNREEEFWSKELAANATPAKDISNLSYLTIPIDKFPLHFSENTDVLAIEDELVELSKKRLLNLTGQTNTEIKLAYGVPNFDTMCKIGDDFDKATVLLNSYGKALIENDMIKDAITVLEYAVGVKTDVSESYTLLADCYRKNENISKLEYLKTQVEQSNLVLKQNILTYINSLTE